MRVLWFTNTPSLAAKLLNYETVAGGWIDSLELKISAREDIELAVAFQYDQSHPQKLNGENSTYYIVPHKQNIFQKLISRHFQVSNDERDIREYLHIIDDFKPDVIQIFGTENNFGLIVDKTTIPVVIHLQGILSVYIKKWLSSGMSLAYMTWHSHLKKMIFGNSWYHQYKALLKSSKRENRIFAENRFFMGRTDWDRRIVRMLSPNAEYFHCDELLRPVFYREEWHKKSRDKLIFLSTIQPNVYKGLETVLAAAAIIKNTCKFEFEWQIAGIKESEELIKLLERHMKMSFKKNNVVLAGSLKSESLKNAMLEADIFIHPSHIDNSPNSVCEAMLVGMPIIATYAGGTGSLLKDKEEGILIQDGDPYSLAGAIAELTENPSFSAQLGRNARIRAMKRHDSEKIVINLISIYRELALKK